MEDTPKIKILLQNNIYGKINQKKTIFFVNISTRLF